jgi:hypothetical protein
MSLIDVVNATKNLVAFDTPTFTSGDDVVHISRDSLSNRYKVDVNGTVYFMTRKELEATDFNLGAGDDKLIVDADVDANITARFLGGPVAHLENRHGRLWVGCVSS